MSARLRRPRRGQVWSHRFSAGTARVLGSGRGDGGWVVYMWSECEFALVADLRSFVDTYARSRAAAAPPTEEEAP